MYNFYRQRENQAKQVDQTKQAKIEQAKQKVAKAQANYNHAYIVYQECGTTDARQHYLDLGRILTQEQENLRRLEPDS